MTDVQNQFDSRGIKIQQTGVTGVYLPFFIFIGENFQQVLAKIRFTVSLSEKVRGTHMSRLVEILTDFSSTPLKFSDIEKILLDAKEKLDTDFAAIKMAFKFFVKRAAPISEKVSLLDIDCEIAADSNKNFSLILAVPFTSLCPCSKEISEFGAHNQRSICRVKFDFTDVENLNVQDIVRLIENQGSSKIYPLLKREDEKFVTEAAYKNPKFVEDILRDVVISLRQLKNISAFEVECENFESIHNHNAFAFHSEILS